MSAIYFHIPFCRQACTYCDFHFSTRLVQKGGMVDALLAELRMRKGELGTSRVASVYFGGGTPSLLDPVQIARLLNAVRADFKVDMDAEITLEANPDDLTEGYLTQLAKTGINRLSLGIQSFHNADLELMNRAHTADQALGSLMLATAYFGNISIDLIYGIPGSGMENWQANVDRVLDLGIPHISAYALTVEPGTLLAHRISKGALAEVDEVLVEAQFRYLIQATTAAGYDHYELSNFGKPGYYSRNNTAYWQQKEYIGIGPSAHSFDGQHRMWNVANNPKYLRAIAKGILPRETETLTLTDRYNEYIMTGLRTHWGISLGRIATEFGPEYAEYAVQQAARHLTSGRLFQDGEVIKVAERGKFLIDGMAADLFMVNLA